MKTNVATTATLISSLLFAGASLAGAVQSDSEGDMIYGNGAVAPSPSQPYVHVGPVQNGAETDFLYHRDELREASPFQSPERMVDDRDISTDLIYGS
jgi:hypothetical protein